jgi:hypothetical protein
LGLHERHRKIYRFVDTSLLMVLLQASKDYIRGDLMEDSLIVHFHHNVQGKWMELKVEVKLQVDLVLDAICSY